MYRNYVVNVIRYRNSLNFSLRLDHHEWFLSVSIQMNTFFISGREHLLNNEVQMDQIPIESDADAFMSI